MTAKKINVIRSFYFFRFLQNMFHTYPIYGTVGIFWTIACTNLTVEMQTRITFTTRWDFIGFRAHVKSVNNFTIKFTIEIVQIGPRKHTLNSWFGHERKLVYP